MSVSGSAALQAVGFDPVGAVMGATVQQTTWRIRFPRCGYPGTGRNAARWVAHRAYAAALTAGYVTALDRLVAEAGARGADGVIGIEVAATTHDNGVREILARGTAVRARSRARPARMFTTHLSGSGTATLLLSGWVPAATVFGVSAAVAHIDDGPVLGELGNCTALVTAVGAEARRRFTQGLRETGADGAIVDSRTVTVHDVVPYPQHSDYLAVASLFGTAVAALPRPAAAAPRTLPVLPVRRPPSAY